MRISELSRTTEVPVATIKFYLREGLLPEGVLTSATQAQYSETHVARLRLIRALLGPGGLSIVKARQVLQAIDNPPESVHALLGVAADAASRPAGDRREHPRVHQLMATWGWPLDNHHCPTHDALESALDALDAAEFELPAGALDHYRDHMTAVAQAEIDGVPIESPAAAVRYVVLGTVLVEPVLLALRRMAQQEISRRRFAELPRLG